MPTGCTAGNASEPREGSLPPHTRRFMVAAQDPNPAWIPWPKNRRLDEFFCFKYRRVVGNDNTVQFGSHIIDIPRTQDRISRAHARVEVHERFHGTLCVFADRLCLAKKGFADPKTSYRVAVHSKAADLVPVALMPKPKTSSPARSTPPTQPAANHPWRRAIVGSR